MANPHLASACCGGIIQFTSAHFATDMASKVDKLASNIQLASREEKLTVPGDKVDWIADRLNSMPTASFSSDLLEKRVDSMEVLLFRASMKDFEEIDKRLVNMKEQLQPAPAQVVRSADVPAPSLQKVIV
jgi:hypothetical protein